MWSRLLIDPYSCPQIGYQSQHLQKFLQFQCQYLIFLLVWANFSFHIFSLFESSDAILDDLIFLNCLKLVFWLWKITRLQNWIFCKVKFSIEIYHNRNQFFCNFNILIVPSLTLNYNLAEMKISVTRSKFFKTAKGLNFLIF